MATDVTCGFTGHVANSLTGLPIPWVGVEPGERPSRRGSAHTTRSLMETR